MKEEQMSMIDWDFAAATARSLVSAGPDLTPEQALAEVEAIRAAARAAYEPVAATSQLVTPDEAPPARVVDRASWIGINVASMRDLVDPVLEGMLERRGVGAPHPAVAAIGGKVTGSEAGALLAFVATKVLGQYDLAPGGTPQLLLVAPNIVQVQRELDVDPADFRSWVCLHEETHRVQFTAVPWLRDHLVTSARALAIDLTPDPAALADLVRRLAERLPQALGSDGDGLVGLLATEEQRAQLARLTAVMSLLEGHADVVMDDVGPAVIPSVAQIRRLFTARREGVGLLDKLLRRVIGLDAKMRQYRDGAAFVRGVQSQVGVEGFNAVWASPDTLPTPDEIADPSRWVARVHG